MHQVIIGSGVFFIASALLKEHFDELHTGNETGLKEGKIRPSFAIFLVIRNTLYILIHSI
jgi:hypothetical protein